MAQVSTGIRPRQPTVNSATGFEAVLNRALSGKPLKPKSLIMTIFGDSVVPRGGVIWLTSLVEFAQEFGLAEPLLRTSALRLTYDGWLVREQIGKLAYYSMSGDYAAAEAVYQNQIYRPSATLRDNGWTIFRPLFDRLDRKTSDKLRRALSQYGFGQLAPSVMIHPSIGKTAVHHIVSSCGDDAGVVFFANELDSSSLSIRHLVESAWDLTEVHDGYEDFLSDFGDLPALLESATPEPAVAFALRTLMIHRYRRLALRDPRLPPSLLPADWPGERCFNLVSSAYIDLLPESEAFLDQRFIARDNATPKSDKQIFQRFRARQ